MSWFDEAACRGNDPEAFLVTLRGEGAHLPLALDTCKTCPRPGACLAYGWDDEWGVYGGTTPRQRVRMRRLGVGPLRCACGVDFVPSEWSPASCGPGCPAAAPVAVAT